MDRPGGKRSVVAKANPSRFGLVVAASCLIAAVQACPGAGGQIADARDEPRSDVQYAPTDAGEVGDGADARDSGLPCLADPTIDADRDGFISCDELGRWARVSGGPPGDPRQMCLPCAAEGPFGFTCDTIFPAECSGDAGFRAWLTAHCDRWGGLLRVDIGYCPMR